MATTQLIIHFERLLRIKIEIPLCIFFSRYSSVVFKEYICAFVGHYQSRILEVSFPSNVVACKTVPKIIMCRYSIFPGICFIIKLMIFLCLQRKLGSIITSKNSQTMLKGCYLYACFIGGR